MLRSFTLAFADDPDALAIFQADPAQWLEIVCLVAFVFASPLLLLVGEASIYNEAVIWGLAGSLAALFFAFRSRETSWDASHVDLLAFSINAG